MLKPSGTFPVKEIVVKILVKISRYKAIKKAAKNIDQLHLNYSGDIKAMEAQLQNLRTDISTGSWEKDSIRSFLDFEAGKIEELSENIGTFVVNCEFIVETHDSLADKVKEYTIVF